MQDLTFTGYPIESENRDWLRENAAEATLLLMGELPVRVDPRLSPLGKQGWLRVENQSQISSCQGNSLTECAEYCYPIANPGHVVQLSRMYAYIASQQENNIKGDNGSTLEGGTKALLKGICTEAVGPYPQSYPGWGYITQAMRDDAKYKLRSIVEIKSADHGKQFIGSGTGIIQIGIPWGNSMEPDSNGCVRSFSPGRGGHAICLAGYIPDSDIGVKSSAGYWFLLKNSWGQQYGVKGYAYVDPLAVDQMLRNKFTSMYGRSDMEAPSVRPLPVDWTKESVLG